MEKKLFLVQKDAKVALLKKDMKMKIIIYGHQKIIALIETMDKGKGASWEKILTKAEENGMDKNMVEETVNSLMDKGIVYEPILGRLKKI